MMQVRRELATVVDEESAHLDALIGEAVEMAELDAKVLKVQRAPQHTRMLLEHAIEASRTLLRRHQVTVMVQEPDTPVWFDAKLLGRVFRHLIENAAQYSPPESRIVLRSRRVEGRLEFEVEDSGHGIDKVRFAAYLREVLSRQKGRETRQGNWHGARHCPRHHAGARRRDRSREQSGTRERLSFLGAAGRETGNRNRVMIRLVLRSSRTQCRGLRWSFVSPTQERGPRARRQWE